MTDAFCFPQMSSDKFVSCIRGLQLYNDGMRRFQGFLFCQSVRKHSVEYLQTFNMTVFIHHEQCHFYGSMCTVHLNKSSVDKYICVRANENRFVDNLKFFVCLFLY